jgi:hypothetical protein
MVGKSKLDRRGSGPWFYVAIVVLVYGLLSLTIAGTTYDDCGARPKEWRVVPPEWECK